jgi:hypothetical protein
MASLGSRLSEASSDGLFAFGLDRVQRAWGHAIERDAEITRALG